MQIKKYLVPVTILILLLILLGYTIFSLTQTIQSGVQSGNLRLQRHPHEFLTRRSSSTVAFPVVSIQSWMTFDYIEKNFHLPKNYFKTALGITDTRYPFLSLKRFATVQKKSETVIVNEVKQAIVQSVNVAP